jgi:hypothetical protein
MVFCSLIYQIDFDFLSSRVGMLDNFLSAVCSPRENFCIARSASFDCSAALV